MVRSRLPAAFEVSCTPLRRSESTGGDAPSLCRLIHRSGTRSYLDLVHLDSLCRNEVLEKGTQKDQNSSGNVILRELLHNRREMPAPKLVNAHLLGEKLRLKKGTQEVENFSERKLVR
ncbi:hypothetical protein EYF80_063095 [Liparis tanakae]|uniref:Uncharacterized protein n=1 Tax=Liparis tanakae TaxID=230148 RepID=A0A4Z2ECY7_9TELE|nr:hypothetical protein EYF80_063095 [Liparis tanakae]